MEILFCFFEPVSIRAALVQRGATNGIWILFHIRRHGAEACAMAYMHPQPFFEKTASRQLCCFLIV
jgi:hypothetical protein